MKKLYAAILSTILITLLLATSDYASDTNRGETKYSLEVAQVEIFRHNNPRQDEPRYNTISEVPEWARPTIEELIHQRYLQGVGGNADRLNLSEDMIRILVILDRAQVFEIMYEYFYSLH